MASPTAFSAAAATDAALPVPRRPRARGLGLGVYVSVRASVFSEEYAREEFGASWRTARVGEPSMYSLVPEALGH